MEKKITIPIPANIILQELIAGITEIKDDFIKGLYVTGSIPLQDYHPDKSDIDFLILCKKLPDIELRMRLAALHRKIKQKFKRSNLSGIYLTPDGLDVRRAQTTQTLAYREGQMLDSNFDMAPVTLYELKTTAITLFGIPAQQLPVAIHLTDLKRFLSKNINSYWKAWIAKHAAFNRCKLLLILVPRLTEWVILGVARQLYTLRTGKIASKTDAGYYCLEHLPVKSLSEK